MKKYVVEILTSDFWRNFLISIQQIPFDFVETSVELCTQILLYYSTAVLSKKLRQYLCLTWEGPIESVTKIASVWKQKIVGIISWSVRNDSGIIILDYGFGTYAAGRCLKLTVT